MSRFPQKVRDQVANRSQLLCEGCGGPGPLELHHRQYRSRGGQDVVENALALCGGGGGMFGGNHSGCHGKAHTAEGEALGWSVRSGFDPADVAIVHAIHGLCQLRDDGSVTVRSERCGVCNLLKPCVCEVRF